METIMDLLTPEQLDIILAAYDTVAEWYHTAAEYVSVQYNSIVNEDVIL